jgi:hypothetical protein
MIHERTNEMKRMKYTENANEQMHDTRNERTIHWSVTMYYPMANDPGSIEVQYTRVVRKVRGLSQ